MARRTALAVVYADGTEATIPVKPVSMVAAERQFGGNIPMVEGTIWAAWHSLKKPMGNFDVWLSTIDAMEEIELDEPKTDKAAPSIGGDGPEADPTE